MDYSLDVCEIYNTNFNIAIFIIGSLSNIFLLIKQYPYFEKI